CGRAVPLGAVAPPGARVGPRLEAVAGRIGSLLPLATTRASSGGLGLAAESGGGWPGGPRSDVRGVGRQVRRRGSAPAVLGRLPRTTGRLRVLAGPGEPPARPDPLPAAGRPVGHRTARPLRSTARRPQRWLPGASSRPAFVVRELALYGSHLDRD